MSHQKEIKTNQTWRLVCLIRSRRIQSRLDKFHNPIWTVILPFWYSHSLVLTSSGKHGMDVSLVNFLIDCLNYGCIDITCLGKYLKINLTQLTITVVNNFWRLDDWDLISLLFEIIIWFFQLLFDGLGRLTTIMI